MVHKQRALAVELQMIRDESPELRMERDELDATVGRAVADDACGPRVSPSAGEPAGPITRGETCFLGGDRARGEYDQEAECGGLPTRVGAERQARHPTVRTDAWAG